MYHCIRHSGYSTLLLLALLQFVCTHFALVSAVCKPFPSHLQPQNDFTAVSAALDAIPSLYAVHLEDSQQICSSIRQGSNNSSSRCPTDLQLRLLQWLLLQLQLKRGFNLNPVSAEQLQDELQAGSSCPPGLLHHLQGCRCILRLVRPGAHPPAPGNCVAAFHGTDFANIHR